MYLPPFSSAVGYRTRKYSSAHGCSLVLLCWDIRKWCEVQSWDWMDQACQLLKGCKIKNSPHGIPWKIIVKTNIQTSRSEQALRMSAVSVILLWFVTGTEHSEKFPDTGLFPSERRISNFLNATRANSTANEGEEDGDSDDVTLLRDVLEHVVDEKS